MVDRGIRERNGENKLPNEDQNVSSFAVESDERFVEFEEAVGAVEEEEFERVEGLSECSVVILELSDLTLETEGEKKESE